jgi:hypothetical protein
MSHTPPDTLFTGTAVEFLNEIADSDTMSVVFKFEFDAAAKESMNDI